MGQRGQLDRLPVAHTASVTALDWCNPGSSTFSGPDGVIGLGWIVSGGLDRTVKVTKMCSSIGFPSYLSVGMGSHCTGIQCAYSPQTNIHSPSFLSCPSCPLETLVPMRARCGIQRGIRYWIESRYGSSSCTVWRP